MMEKRILALLLAAVMLLSVVGCGNQNDDPSMATTELVQTEHLTTTTPSLPPETTDPAEVGFQPYTFTDSLGHTVEIKEPITSIVPSGTLAQVILLGLGQDLFAGLGSKLYEDAAGYVADYARLSGLTYFGTIVGSEDLDVEALASTNADLIIDMGYRKDGLEKELDRVEDLTGMKCVFIEADLGSYSEAIRQVGKLLRREDQAERMAAWCEETYDRAQKIIEQVGDNRVKAMYALGEGGLSVIPQGTSQAEIIDLLTDNVAVVEGARSTGKGTAVNMEQIALWNPEFVIFGPDSIYETAASDPTWSQIDAIANGRYVETPNIPYNWTAIPPASQRYLAMLWLPTILYPEFCDYDLQEEVLEYYELFLGVALTQEQYEALTGNAFPE